MKSLTPKFTIDKNDRLYLDKDYLSNGHWLVHRRSLGVRHSLVQKELLKVQNVALGAYQEGYGQEQCGTIPDFAQAIPKRDGYKPLGKEVRAYIPDYTWPSIYVFRLSLGEEWIGINYKYLPLLSLGHAFGRNKESPILVLDSDDLNGELLAVVMPMRL